MAEVSRSRGFMASVRRWIGRRGVSVPQLPAQPVERPSMGSMPVDPRIGVMLAEWQDIRASLRYWGDRRLAQLAIFIIASAAIAGAFLRVAAAPGREAAIARWTLPALGMLVSLVCLALELGSHAYRRGLGQRGRQIETALHVLLPGIGHVKSLALLSEFQPDDGEWLRTGAWAVPTLYGLILLGWAAAFAAAALGGLVAGHAP